MSEPPTDPMLATTGYAVLGLLAAEPLPARSLVAVYRARLGRVWPRTDALLYEEIRRLNRLGYITAGTDPLHTYHVTPAGIAALRAWHARPPSSPRLDVEAALRVDLAASGDVADVRRSVDALGAWAAATAQATRPATDAAGTDVGAADELVLALCAAIESWSRRQLHRLG